MSRAQLMKVLRAARLSDAEILAVMARFNLLQGEAQRLLHLATSTGTPIATEIARYHRTQPQGCQGRVGRIP